MTPAACAMPCEIATGQKLGNNGSNSDAAVTRIAAPTITMRFDFVASTSAPAGVCATMPAIAAIDMTMPMPGFIPFLFGQEIDGEIGAKPVPDIGQKEIGGIERATGYSLVFSLWHRDSSLDLISFFSRRPGLVLAAGLVVVLGPRLGLVLRCLDGAKAVHFAADFFSLGRRDRVGFLYRRRSRRSFSARCEKLGEVFGLLRTDAYDGAIGQQRAAKFAFRTEQREPDGSLKLHLFDARSSDVCGRDPDPLSMICRPLSPVTATAANTSAPRGRTPRTRSLSPTFALRVSSPSMCGGV